MQKYDAVNKLSPTEFKRLTGVRKDVFAKMVAIVQEEERIRMSQGGKPPRLVVISKDCRLFLLRFVALGKWRVRL